MRLNSTFIVRINGYKIIPPSWVGTDHILPVLWLSPEHYSSHQEAAVSQDRTRNLHTTSRALYQSIQNSHISPLSSTCTPRIPFIPPLTLISPWQHHHHHHLAAVYTLETAIITGVTRALGDYTVRGIACRVAVDAAALLLKHCAEQLTKRKEEEEEKKISSQGRRR